MSPCLRPGNLSAGPSGFSNPLFVLVGVFLLAGLIVGPAAAAPQDVLDFVDGAKMERYSAPVPASISQAEFRKLQEIHRLYLLLGIIGATPVLLFLVLAYLKRSPRYSAQTVVNASGMVLVIQATIFVVMASPTTEQLTAAIGVLGAIAGYLFGAAQKKGASEEE